MEIFYIITKKKLLYIYIFLLSIIVISNAFFYCMTRNIHILTPVIGTEKERLRAKEITSKYF